MWSVIESASSRDDGGSLKDLTLFPGSRYKIIRIDSLLLNKKFNIDQDYCYDGYDEKIVSDVVTFDISSTDPS